MCFKVLSFYQTHHFHLKGDFNIFYIHDVLSSLISRQSLRHILKSSFPDILRSSPTCAERLKPAGRECEIRPSKTPAHYWPDQLLSPPSRFSGWARSKTDECDPMRGRRGVDHLRTAPNRPWGRTSTGGGLAWGLSRAPGCGNRVSE